MQQSSSTIISITVLVVLLVLYSFRNAYSGITEEEETLVSLCQVHTQLDESHGFDDRTLLSLLAALKMHDFKIGQPVWGPSNTLMYLCEYRLKSGPKLTAIDQELKTVIKNNGASSKNLGWSCA